MNGVPAAAIPIIARDMIPTKNARNRGSFTRWLWSAFRRVADSDSDRGRSNAGVSSTSATEAASPGGGGGTAHALGTALGGGGRTWGGGGAAGGVAAGGAVSSRDGSCLPHFWQNANSRRFQIPQYGQGRLPAASSGGRGGGRGGAEGRGWTRWWASRGSRRFRRGSPDKNVAPSISEMDTTRTGPPVSRQGVHRVRPTEGGTVTRTSRPPGTSAPSP